VLILASLLQLALNLLDFGYIAGGKKNAAVEDYEQHVNQRVSWDVYEFSEHGRTTVLRSEDQYVLWAIRVPGENTCK
jgi:hypothetical protein